MCGNSAQTPLKFMTILTIFWRLFPAPVSGARNRRQLSGARNHETLSRQMIPAEKETKMCSDFKNFENNDVIAAVLTFRFRLLKNSKKAT